MWMDVKHIWCFLQKNQVNMSRCPTCFSICGLMIVDRLFYFRGYCFTMTFRSTSDIHLSKNLCGMTHWLGDIIPKRSQNWFVKTDDPWNLGITKFPQDVPSRIPHKQIPDMFFITSKPKRGQFWRQGIPFSKENMRNQVSMTLHWLNHVKSQFSMVKSSFSNMCLTIVH